MKFSVSSKELQNKLSVVSKVIKKKNVLNIFNYAMVSQVGESFYLTGASQEAQLTVPLDIRQIGKDSFVAFCVDVAQFLAILGTLSTQPLEIEVDEEQKFATCLRYDGGCFQLSSQSSENFPLQEDMSEDASAMVFHVSPAVFLPIVRSAYACTADDPLRPMIASVALDVSVEGITFVGTDTHRLYKYQYTHGVPFLEQGEPGTVLLPRNSLSALESAFAKDESMRVRSNGKRIEFVSDNAVLKLLAVSGKYPAYDRVIPKETNYHVVMSVADLAIAVKRTSLMANVDSVLVFEMRGGEVTLSVSNIDFGRSADAKVPSSESNIPDGFRMGFCPSYLLDLLGNISTEKVKMCFINPDKVAVMKEDAENSPLVEILMPMKIDC